MDIAIRALGMSVVELNPGIRASLSEINARQSERDAAWQQFLPTPSFNADKADQRTRLQLNQRTTTLRLTQPLWQAGRLQANLDRADAASASARHASQAQIISTLEQLIQTFARRQSASLRSQTLQASLQTHERLLAQVERRIKEGLSPQADLLVAQSRLASVTAEYVSTLGEIRQQTLLLQRIMGRQISSPEEIALAELSAPATTAVEPDNLSDADIAAIAMRQPQILRQLAELEQLTHRITGLKANRYPQLSLRLERSHGDITGTENTAFLSISSSWGAGLSNESEIDALEHRQRATTHDMDAQGQELTRRIGSLQVDLYQQLARYGTLMDGLKQTREFQASTERLYLTGRKAWLDVLNAAREVSSTESAVHDALIQAWSNKQLLVLLKSGPADWLMATDTLDPQESSTDPTTGTDHVQY